MAEDSNRPEIDFFDTAIFDSFDAVDSETVELPVDSYDEESVVDEEVNDR